MARHRQCLGPNAEHEQHLGHGHAVRVGRVRRARGLLAREREAKLAARRGQPVALVRARLQHDLVPARVDLKTIPELSVVCNFSSGHGEAWQIRVGMQHDTTVLLPA